MLGQDRIPEGIIDLFKLAPPILLSVLACATAAAQTPPESRPQTLPMTRVQLAQVTIEQRVIIRIPLVRPGAPNRRGTAAAPPLPDDAEAPAFRETKGPKCLRVDQLRGAVINPVTGVTMVTDKEERFRTYFGRMCRAADFYSGFYVEPHQDGSICAGRDVLHARNGSTCSIERFGKLVPEE